MPIHRQLRQCRKLIEEAASLVRSEGPSGLPTLHAHTILVTNFVKAYEIIQQLDDTDMNEGACLRMYWTVYELMERFRDALSRLRLDPEANCEEPTITLCLLVMLIHLLGSRETFICPCALKFPNEPLHVDDVPWKRLLEQNEGSDAANDAANGEPNFAYVQHYLAKACSDGSTQKERGELALRYTENLVRLVRYQITNTLRTSDLPSVDLSAAVESLVNKADAELGAMVFKDLVISFMLPRGMVGLRHTLLMSRSLNENANSKFSGIVNRAHCAALQGPGRVWKHGVLESISIVSDGAPGSSAEKDANFLHEAERIHKQNEEAEQKRLNSLDCIAAAEMERSCVLLAGLAMLLAPSSSDVRKGVAFQGKVRLPFLTVPMYRNGNNSDHSEIELLPDGSWSYLILQEGTLKLRYRGHGLEGLRIAASLFMYDASR